MESSKVISLQDCYWIFLHVILSQQIISLDSVQSILFPDFYPFASEFSEYSCSFISFFCWKLSFYPQKLQSQLWTLPSQIFVQWMCSSEARGANFFPSLLSLIFFFSCLFSVKSLNPLILQPTPSPSPSVTELSVLPPCKTSRFKLWYWQSLTILHTDSPKQTWSTPMTAYEGPDSPSSTGCLKGESGLSSDFLPFGICGRSIAIVLVWPLCNSFMTAPPWTVPSPAVKGGGWSPCQGDQNRLIGETWLETNGISFMTAKRKRLSFGDMNVTANLERRSEKVG